VTNTGGIAGDEVVQLYIHQQGRFAFTSDSRTERASNASDCNRENRKQFVSRWGKRELTYWSESRSAWVEKPERFDVRVGGDSNAQLRASFRVVE
jgi:hypothetical protein